MRWFRLQFLKRARSQRNRIRQWLEGRPRLAAFLERSGCLHVDEFAVGRGIALGLFIGLTPTVGIQTVLMVIGSMVFRANFPAAFLVSFVSNPLTVAPLYYGFNRLGQLLLSLLPISLPDVGDLGEEIARETLEIFLGSMVIAIPVAVTGYFMGTLLWRRFFPPASSRKPDQSREISDQ